jgi:hypothetical protein
VIYFQEEIFHLNSQSFGLFYPFSVWILLSSFISDTHLDLEWYLTYQIWSFLNSLWTKKHFLSCYKICFDQLYCMMLYRCLASLWYHSDIEDREFSLITLPQREIFILWNQKTDRLLCFYFCLAFCSEDFRFSSILGPILLSLAEVFPLLMQRLLNGFRTSFNRKRFWGICSWMCLIKF